MLTYVTILGYILTLALAFALLFKSKLTEMLPVSIFIPVIWTVSFGYFDKLSLGVMLLAPASLGLLSVALLKSYFSKEKFNLLKHITPSLMFFIFFSALSFEKSRVMKLSQWDEFTQWGFAVKVSYLFDVLQPSSPSYTLNATYVPGLSIFPYIISKISSSWNEGNIFWAYHLIVLAIFSAVLSRFNWRQIHLLSLSFVLLLLASVIFYDLFRTAYADPIMAVILAYLLYLAIQKFSRGLLFSFIGTEIFFLLSKEIATAMVLIPILLFAANFLIAKRENVTFYKSALTALAIFTLMIIILGVTKISWSLYLAASYNQEVLAEGQNKNPNLSNLLNSASSGFFERIKYHIFDETGKADAIQSLMVDRIINSSLTPWIGFSISPLEWAIMISLLIFIAALYQRDKYKRATGVNAAFITFFGSLFYFYVLFLSYLTIYSGTNAYGLTSFDRYVSSFLSGTFIFSIFFAVQEFGQPSTPKLDESNASIDKFKLKTPVASILATSLILLTGPQGRITSVINNPGSYSEPSRVNTESIAARISNAKFTVDDRIWIIAQHTQGYEFFVLQYESLPASGGPYPYSLGELKDDGDIWTDPNLTKEKWEKELDKIDFVIIYQVSEAFVRDYGSLFEKNTDFTQQGIFRVVHSPGGNTLEPYA